MRTHRIPPQHPRSRRLPALLAVTAVVALLPVVAVAAPSQAADECLSEAASGFGSQRCDDVTPPETSLLSADPTANANGYIRVDHVTIGFAGAYTDADADPMAFQCQFYEAAEAPTAWSSCTSPVSYTGLDDTTTVPYTFRVRAVDTADNGIDATASGGIFGPSGAATDLPDYDQTPATASFYVDTSAPNTFVFDEPFDSYTPDHPMIKTPDLTVDLESNESGATFVCAVSGRRTPCAGSGDTTFSGLKPGNQVLTVTTVDRAGNVDTTPTSTPFSVPRNLTPQLGHGFSLVTSATGNHFGGDYLRSTKVGSTLVVKSQGSKEVRVLAPTGPGFGTIEMAQGQHAFFPLKQTGKARGLAVVYQKYFNRAFTGPLTFRVVKANAKKPAVLDAILLH